MKQATLTFHKSELLYDIDARTFKRVDASMDQASERAQNAVASDNDEELDSNLCGRYLVKWDAVLRKKLKFCLVRDESAALVFDDNLDNVDSFVYNVNVPDEFTVDDIKTIGPMIHDFLVRGALFDWYLHTGSQPLDTNDSVEDIAGEIATAFRGRSYGRRPIQPFGPGPEPYEY